MSSSNSSANCRLTGAAFTLLEIMLAMAILMIITVVIYQFTDATVSTAAASEKLTDHDTAYNGVRRLIEMQLGSIPTSESGAFLGINIKGGGGRRDMLQLVCPAGNAILTPDAKGFYQITLGVRETPRGSGKYFLGMQRDPWTSDDDDDDDDDDDGKTTKAVDKATSNKAPKDNRPSDWVGLMPGVNNLEMAYFDARLNGWVDKWTDQSALPNLVRMRISTANDPTPYEIIARVPNGGPRPAITPPPTLNQGPSNGGNGNGSGNTTNPAGRILRQQ